jgi:hypothetical protein
MSEAGKEILLREALATHMRSPRDRQMVAGILADRRPLEELLSFFSAFYLVNYQDVHIKQNKAGGQLTIEQKGDTEKESRRLLELEVRQILGNKQREEFDRARLVSEFSIALCDIVNDTNASEPQTVKRVVTQLKSYLSKLPREYAGNHDVDLVNEVTGWGPLWRSDIYAKASGLKESSMSLRDELLREHEEEVPETSILKLGIARLLGRPTCLTARLMMSGVTDETWDEVALAAIGNLPKGRNRQTLKRAHELRIAVLDAVEGDIDTPTTIGDFENRIADIVAKKLSTEFEKNPTDTFTFLGCLLGLNPEDIRVSLQSKGIATPADLAVGLSAFFGRATASKAADLVSRENLEDLTRSLKTLEKIEQTLERSVKGMLRSRGLNKAELDKISLQLLTKDRSSLIGIEIEVVEELKKKVRLPPPDEIERLIKARASLQGTGAAQAGAASAHEMGQQLRQEETIASLKLDIVWHFMIGLFTNLTRVVETYVRSKQDLLRTKALLKSIYEKTETELQYLREEILIDLTANRVQEFKCVHPELDTPAISGWLHARFSGLDMALAESDLESTPSPVFEGIAESPLGLSGLECDNYAVAFDLMSRFLKQERAQRMVKEEAAIQAQLAEQRIADSKRKTLDPLLFIYTKAHTVFRAIGRLGTKGLEWTPIDDAKCANLLSYYVRVNRGRLVCSVCGETPKEGVCPTHGKSDTTTSNDMDNLAVFVMRALTDIKSGLIGPTSEAMPWDKTRAIIQREVSLLRQRGKLTAKTNVRELIPGELNYIVGPAIAAVVGKYFNESLEYAARRADLA